MEAVPEAAQVTAPASSPPVSATQATQGRTARRAPAPSSAATTGSTRRAAAGATRAGREPSAASGTTSVRCRTATTTATVWRGSVSAAGDTQGSSVSSVSKITGAILLLVLRLLTNFI